VGVLRQNGQTVLNPRGADIINPGDNVIILGARKGPLVIHPKAANLTSDMPRKNDKESQKIVNFLVKRPRVNFLVLGWRPGISSILHEIDGSVGHGSHVTIVSEIDPGERGKLLHQEHFKGMKETRLSHIVADPCDQSRMTLATLAQADAILVLMDHASPAMTSRHREAKVLECLLSLRLEFEKANICSPKIVAEVMDRESERLARAEYPYIECLSLNDFSALLLAQAAYVPDILPILHELLSREGPELALRKASLFFHHGERGLRFEEIMTRGRASRETVLGYISEIEGRVTLHPPKSQFLLRSEVRRMVTMTEDIHSVCPIND
jgi:hypothetical protein